MTYLKKLSLLMLSLSLSAQAAVSIDVVSAQDVDLSDILPITATVSYEAGDKINSITASGLSVLGNCNGLKSTAGSCELTLTPLSANAGSKVNAKLAVATSKGRVQSNILLNYLSEAQAETPVAKLDLALTQNLGSLTYPGSKVHNITIKNTGSLATANLTATLSGTGYKLRSNTCNGRALSPAGSCAIAVQYDAPNDFSGNKTATLTLADGAAINQSSALTIALSNEVKDNEPVPSATAELQISTQESTNVIAPNRIFISAIIKNIGLAATISKPVISMAGQGWSIRSNSCLALLQPNAQCQLSLQFDSIELSNGSYLGTLTVDGSDELITANLTGASFAVAISSAANGSIGGVVDGQSYNVGTQLSITATPSVGYSFSSWTGDCSGQLTETCSLVINADKTIGAIFEQEIQINITQAAGGVISYTINPAEPEFEIPASVSITATPDSGYYFNSWTGDCSANSSASCYLNLDGSKTLSAVFDKNPCTKQELETLGSSICPSDVYKSSTTIGGDLAADKMIPLGSKLIFFSSAESKLKSLNPVTQVIEELTTGLNSLHFYKRLVNGQQFFIGSSSSQGAEIWRTDGTASGTYLVKEINVGSGSSVTFSDVTVKEWDDLNGTLYVTATTGASQGFYKTNGTLNNLELIATMPSKKIIVQSATNILVQQAGAPNVSRGIHRYNPNNPVSGSLGVCDSTTHNPCLSFQMQPASNANLIAKVNSRVIVSSLSALGGSHVFSWDGVTPVHQLSQAGIDGYMEIGNNRKLVPNTTSFPIGIETDEKIYTSISNQLGITDGSTVTYYSSILPQFAPGFTKMDNGDVFFLATLSGQGSKRFLIKHEGLDAQTIPPTSTNIIDHINNEFSIISKYTDPLTSIQKLAFIAKQGFNGLNLWISDSTPQGTEEISNFIRPNSFQNSPAIVQVGDYLFFNPSNSTSQYQPKLHFYYLGSGTPF